MTFQSCAINNETDQLILITQNLYVPYIVSYIAISKPVGSEKGPRNGADSEKRSQKLEIPSYEGLVLVFY